MKSALDQLCDWYSSNCDGEWEHQHGVMISTLDNPGWLIRIDLSYTDQELKPIALFEDHRTEHDWVVAKEDQKEDSRYYFTAGGPNNIEEMIQRFLDWTNDAL